MKDRFKSKNLRNKIHRREQEDRAAKAHMYAVKRAAKPHRVIVPKTRVKETVEEFLARGGQIKECPTAIPLEVVINRR